MRRIPYTLRVIPYQSFGLDKKKTVRKRSFFLAPPAGLEPSVIFAAPARQTSNLLAHLTWAFRKRNRKVRPCSRFAGAEVERTFGLSGEKEPKKSPRRLPRAFFALIVQKCNLTNHAKGVYGIKAKPCMKSSRSDVWNQSAGKCTLKRDAMRDFIAIPYNAQVR